MEIFSFGQENDYGREEIAKRYLHLIDICNSEITPTLLYGNWGTGKTTFCKKLISMLEHLRQENSDKIYLTPIYLDAFLTDYIDNPLLSIVAALSNLDVMQIGVKDKIIDAIKGLTSPQKAGTLLSEIGLNLLGVCTNGFSDQVIKTSMEELRNFNKQSINSFAINSLLDDYADACKSMKILQSAITEICKEKPVLLIIDELDRCKPDYAIKMLETIKHFHDIENLYILLVVNRQQLCASIEKHYGYKINANEYLEKFFSYSFELSMLQPNVMDISRCNEMLFRYIEEQVEQDERMPKTIENSKYSSYTYYSPIKAALFHLNPSMRQLNTFIRHIKLYGMLVKYRNNENLQEGYSDKCYPLIQSTTYLAIMAFCFYPSIRSQCLNNSLEINSLAEEMFGIHQLHLTDTCKSKDEELIEWALIALYRQSLPYEEKEQVEENIWWRKYITCDMVSPSFNSYEHFMNVVKILALW